MNRRIITLILALAAVCGGVMAQPKVSGRVPTREKRGYDQQIVIDTANVRVLYALNAKDIKDENTYIDLGKLEVGKRVKKYSSEFIDLSDEEAVKWKKKTGHTGYVPKSFWIGGILISNGRFIVDGRCIEIRFRRLNISGGIGRVKLRRGGRLMIFAERFQ